MPGHLPPERAAGAAAHRLPTLRHRNAFLAANRGVRVVTPSFILLVAPNDAGGPRVGFTASKKVGNAVARNRARRRLREIARQVLAHAAVPGADHVFIARAEPTERPFAAMLADADAAVARAARKMAAA